MNLPRPVGSRVSASKGMRVPLYMPQANVRRKRSSMFLLGDAGGRVLYSGDGIQWKQAASSGIAAVDAIAVSRSTVVIDDLSTARYASSDLRRPWTNVGTGASTGRYALPDGSFLAGIEIQDEFGLTVRSAGAVSALSAAVRVGNSLFAREAASNIVYEVSRYATRPVADSAGLIDQLGLGIVFGPYAMHLATADIFRTRLSDWQRADSLALGFNTVQTGFSLMSPIAFGNGVAVVLGVSGNVAVLDDPESIAYAGTVGFTANDLNVCLFNGDVFVGGAVGGAVGISYDGRNWTAVSTGFASDILCGCVSPTVFP